MGGGYLRKLPGRLLGFPRTAEWLVRNTLLLGFFVLLVLIDRLEPLVPVVLLGDGVVGHNLVAIGSHVGHGVQVQLVSLGGKPVLLVVVDTQFVCL